MASAKFGNDDHDKGESRQTNCSLVKCILLHIGKSALYHYMGKLLI